MFDVVRNTREESPIISAKSFVPLPGPMWNIVSNVEHFPQWCTFFNVEHGTNVEHNRLAPWCASMWIAEKVQKTVKTRLAPWCASMAQCPKSPKNDQNIAGADVFPSRTPQHDLKSSNTAPERLMLQNRSLATARQLFTKMCTTMTTLQSQEGRDPKWHPENQKISARSERLSSLLKCVLR